MPGVYWDNSTREAVKQGKSPKMKSRGVNVKDLARQIGKLDLMFAEQGMSIKNGGKFEWPEIQFKVDFLLDSAKLALMQGDWSRAGRVRHNTSRAISSDPISKRHNDAYYDPVYDVVRTRPYQMSDQLESTNYNKSFGYTEYIETEELFHEQITRDGNSPLMDWQDVINS